MDFILVSLKYKASKKDFILRKVLQEMMRVERYVMYQLPTAMMLCMLMIRRAF